jgi:reductive dehalogenase
MKKEINKNDNVMHPLPRIEDYVRRPGFKPVCPPTRFKQTDQVIPRAIRGELGKDLQEKSLRALPPHPKDRTVFGPTMVRALLWPGCEAPVFKYKVDVKDIKKMSTHIKAFAKELGADLVGITYLHPAFIFENDKNGESIQLTHKYAIVMAKEMSFDRISTSPSHADHYEVGKTYHDATVLAVHLANYIGQLGYPARASVMRNDTVFHVPLAVYAGLGEYSRMGRLITKEFGPRVRLATVTTDLPLEVDHPIDLNVEHFCQMCEKCAVNCPAQSIPYGEEKVEIRGFLKWTEDSDKCFKFWRKNTYQWMACSRCISVCPWNKRNNLLHKMVSAVATKWAWAHRFILFFDDLFYGKKPRIRKVPESYNDYIIDEEAYRRITEEIAARNDEVTKKTMR